MRDGTEAVNAEKIRFVGLIQPTYQYDFSDRLSDLTGQMESLNGKKALFSSIAPSFDSTSEVYVFRTRLGVRGLMDKINYEAVAEIGMNAFTMMPGPDGSFTPTLAEGSITLNYVPGLRIRAGLFKVPGSEEGLRAAIDYVNFTQATQFLINPQPLKLSHAPVEYVSDGIPSEPRAVVRAFRDAGVEAFDAFTSDNLEFSYALMAGFGNTPNGNNTNDNNNISEYGRIQFSYIFQSPKVKYKKDRRDLTLFLWGQRDRPSFEKTTYKQNRWGGGLTFFRDGYHVNAEYMYGEGMIYLLPYYVSDSGKLFISDQNNAQGWYIDAGMFVTDHVQLEARYDVFEQNVVDSQYSRIFNTLTLGAQYFFTEKMRLAINYEFHDYDFGNGFNQQQVSNAIGNRLSTQLTIYF